MIELEVRTGPRRYIKWFISGAIIIFITIITAVVYNNSSSQSQFRTTSWPGSSSFGSLTYIAQDRHRTGEYGVNTGGGNGSKVPQALQRQINEIAGVGSAPDNVPLNGRPWGMKQLLKPGRVVPDVHYIWCGRRWFEFKHYLSVKSVLKAVQPDKIYVHYEHHPEYDRVYYNQWIDNLKHDYPWLIMREMQGNEKQFCLESDRTSKVEMIAQLLSREGGMYVSENTFILNFDPDDRSGDFVMAMEPTTTDGYMIVSRGLIHENHTHIQALYSRKIRRKKLVCCHLDHIYQSQDLWLKSPCLVITGDKFSQFYPLTIWELPKSDPFGRLVRRLFYDTEEILEPKPTFEELVPNIGHMIWLGGGPMDYLFYLTVLSLLYVAKVDTVYIHGDMEPAGPYWAEIKRMDQTKDKVLFVTRSQPVQVYQGTIEPWYRALMSDLIRVDLMIKYGGIYTDTDALWVKPLTHEDRGYEAVASFDWVDWSWPYPDSVNFGISYGKKNAPFWRIFRDSMRTLHNDVHGFSGVMMPYKLLEKYPHLLRIDRHLQVICYHSKCHPTWVNDYHNQSKDHTNMGSIPNWRQDVNAFHWTHPNPPEFANRSTLLSGTGIFAEMGREVLRLAGLL